MKSILVVNPKGGCGKSTIATNLASYYALWEVPVALVDYDPQQSSMDWLQCRTSRYNSIVGIDASHGLKKRVSVPGHVERVILDAPARIDAKQLVRLFEFADVVVMPVLPSPIDIRAASDFLMDLILNGMLKDKRVGMVANRVRTNTRMYRKLSRFLTKMRIPLVTQIRDAQIYIRAADTGFGIFEMLPHEAGDDMEHWKPLIEWIEK